VTDDQKALIEQAVQDIYYRQAEALDFALFMLIAIALALVAFLLR
jgi:hypothetical protein